MYDSPAGELPGVLPGFCVELKLTFAYPVSSEERSQYTAIIDGILATANLETISRKKIRQGLETSLGGKDLSEQKVNSLALEDDLRLEC